MVCTLSCCIGLLFVTGSGEYWVKIFDSFAGTTGLIFIALLESVAVMYIYGHRKYVYSYSYSEGMIECCGSINRLLMEQQLNYNRIPIA